MVRKNTILACIILGLAAHEAYAANHDPEVIIPLMKDAKISLVDGIQLVEKTYGPATSAKFEVDDHGKLVLSVYSIPEGLSVEPEKASLSEVMLDPSVANPTLNFQAFADKEHIARAAAHMTLFRLAKLSLVEVLECATRATQATPIDVRNPTVMGKRPVAHVVLADSKGGSLTVLVDLLSGQVRSSK